MILKLNAKNKKYILYILLIVIVLAIYSRLNLNITYVKEDKHDSLNIQNVHINNQRAAAIDSIVKVQEVFRKEDVIALIQKHLNERKKEIETSKIKYDYLKRYPNFLECNMKIIEKWSVNAMYTNDNQQIEYSKQASNETHKHRFVKGILVYFPIEKTNEFIPEFKWLYRSWIEMQKSEPNMWRTDLVVFIEKSVQFLQELNCTFQNKRKHDSDEPMCTLLEYIAVKNRNLTELSNPLFKKENIYEPIEWNTVRDQKQL